MSAAKATNQQSGLEDGAQGDPAELLELGWVDAGQLSGPVPQIVEVDRGLPHAARASPRHGGQLKIRERGREALRPERGDARS